MSIKIGSIGGFGKLPQLGGGSSNLEGHVGLDVSQVTAQSCTNKGTTFERILSELEGSQDQPGNGMGKGNDRKKLDTDKRSSSRNKSLITGERRIKYTFYMVEGI